MNKLTKLFIPLVALSLAVPFNTAIFEANKEDVVQSEETTMNMFGIWGS